MTWFLHQCIAGWLLTSCALAGPSETVTVHSIERPIDTIVSLEFPVSWVSKNLYLETELRPVQFSFWVGISVFNPAPTIRMDVALSNAQHVLNRYVERVHVNDGLRSNHNSFRSSVIREIKVVGYRFAASDDNSVGMHHGFASGGVPGVLPNRSEAPSNDVLVTKLDEPSRIYPLAKHIRASLGDSHVLRHFDSSICGGSGVLRLFQHAFSIVGGPSRMVQGASNQYQTGKSDHDSCSRGDGHPEGPKRHGLLGAQVAVIAGLLALTLGFVFLGYHVADRGLDTFERGRKVYGIGIFLLGALIGCGSGFLIFGGGLIWLLGVNV